MATESRVKEYVAYWLQAGKRLLGPDVPDGYPVPSILQGDRYSPEFEACWDHIRNPASGDYHLEGVDQTIQQLIGEEWDIIACARCNMPVQMVSVGVHSSDCPCSEMGLWPNLDVPQPRSPINSQDRLSSIQARLMGVSMATDQSIGPVASKTIDSTTPSPSSP